MKNFKQIERIITLLNNNDFKQSYYIDHKREFYYDLWDTINWIEKNNKILIKATEAFCHLIKDNSDISINVTESSNNLNIEILISNFVSNSTYINHKSFIDIWSSNGTTELKNNIQRSLIKEKMDRFIFE